MMMMTLRVWRHQRPLKIWGETSNLATQSMAPSHSSWPDASCLGCIPCTWQLEEEEEEEEDHCVVGLFSLEI